MRERPAARQILTEPDPGRALTLLAALISDICGRYGPSTPS